MQKQTSFTVQEAQKKLERYCAYQERCHQEVVQKLKSLNIIPVAIDQIISELITNNYLNETRFAQAYVRGKFRHKKWGKIRIQSQLKLRQIKLSMNSSINFGFNINKKISFCVKKK